MKKSLILTCMICAAAIVCGQGARKAPVVAVSKVMEVNDSGTRNYTGIIVSPSVVEIVPRVSGEIIEVGFKDGDVVKKGQVLYKLDPVRYEAAVAGLKAKIKGIEAKILSCVARQKYAKQNYDRVFSLFQKSAESQDNMESRKAALDAANAELEAARAELEAAKAELITAEDDLKHTRIVSPIDGVAGVSKKTFGNYITPGSGVLVTVIEVDPIRVRFSISTNDYLSNFGSLENMRKSAVVKIRLANGKMYPLEGRIQFLNNEANSRTDAIQVFAEFSNKNMHLINGSTVAVALSWRDSKKVLAVPLSAVVYDQKGACVYVVDAQNKVKKQYFVPGGSNREYQLVVSGLKKDQVIVSAGTHKIVMDGMPVEIAKPAEK